MLSKVLLIISLILLASLATYSVSEQQIPAHGRAERPSPSDWIKEDQIKVYPNRVILTLRNSTWASFTDTNSMDPFLDAESNAIEIKPSTAELINLGDIIAYESPQGVIIHRIIQKDTDEQGIYFIVKGDNNPQPDEQKVRFADVKGVVVAIIY